jgi:Icc-related predicted phosphoesterase
MIRNVLAIADLRGHVKMLDPLAARCREYNCEAILIAGNIFTPGLRAEEWERALAQGRAPAAQEAELHREEEQNSQVLDIFLDWLGKLEIPAFIIPGVLDAPERLFVQGVVDHASISPRVALVHRGFAWLGSQHVVAGFGGRVTESRREAYWAVEYPSWEAEFGLEFMRQFEQRRILLLHSVPAGVPGSAGEPAAVLADLIKMHTPEIVVCAPPDHDAGSIHIGTSLVVWPGRLHEGHYAVIDLRERTAVFGKLTEAAVA